MVLNTDFNKNEIRAIARILLEVMNADKKIATEEALYFLMLKDKLGMSEYDFNEAKSMNSLYAMKVIREMTLEQKRLVAFMMKEMIEADGETSNEEMALFTLVALSCDFLKE